MNPYPEHTPPAPPEGMKWEYRGMGWANNSESCDYYTVSPESLVSPMWKYAQPGENMSYHYFEAVPDVNSTKFYEEIGQALINPHDPKGASGSKKAPLCMLPSFPLHEASWVLKSGADKYGPWNWRENEVCASTYRSAMQRHLDQWFDELEDVDRETNRSHLAHVIANACILMDAAKHGTLVDDRPSMNHDTKI